MTHPLHNLGMAKSCLDLRGAKASKLELDYLKLVLATERLRASGSNAKGYLLVIEQKVEERTKTWGLNYKSDDLVDVIFHEPTPQDLKSLQAEKQNNSDAIKCSANPEAAEAALSVASLGKSFGEDALRAEIIQRHPGIEPITDKDRRPLDVDWDFYGIVP